jgi:hypothetical protein
MPVPSPPAPSSRGNPRGSVDKRQRTNLPRTDFTVSAGIFDLAAHFPADQRLLNYIFDAIPPHTSFPKLTNINNKVDCLICLRGALPPPNNQCQTASCISSKRKNRSGDSWRLHIDLHSKPWRSQQENYWKPVVNFLLLPGDDTVLKPTAAFKQLIPAVPWP